MTRPRDLKNFSFEGLGVLDRLRRPSMYRSSSNASLRWRIHFEIARAGAAGFYLSAILFAIVCPAVFVTNIIANEIGLGYFPTSEQSDAAGAWNPWVGTALVIIAALIVRYHDVWAQYVRSTVRSIWRLLIWPLRRGNTHDQSSHFKGSDQKFEILLESFMSPIHHGWHSVKRDYCNATFALRSFRVWWKDPIQRSRQTRREAQQELDEVLSRIPPCRCTICRSHRANRIEEDIGVLDNFASFHLTNMGKAGVLEPPRLLKRRASA